MAYPPPPFALPDVAPAWDTAAAYSYLIHVGLLVAFGRELDELWAKRRAWFLEQYRWKALDKALEADIRFYWRS